MFTTSSFDHYQIQTSQVHRLDPRIKLVLTISYILTNVVLPDGAWIAFGISWGFLLISAFLSHIQLSFILKRSIIALPFALAAFTIMFTMPGKALTTIDIGSWHLTISDTGLIRFSTILVRSWLSVQMAILLTATTRFTDLAHGLRHLGAPMILIAIISFMYRYLFVLNDQAVALIRARTARSARAPHLKKPSPLWQAKIAGNMIGQLFLRSYERSDRVYNAMLARGFRREFLTLSTHTMQTKDWIVLFIGFLFLSGLIIFGLSLYI